MKILDIKLGKERVCHITKQMMHSFSIIIRISQSKEVGKDIRNDTIKYHT